VKVDDVKNRFADITVYDINQKPFITIAAKHRPATGLRNFLVSQLQVVLSLIKATTRYAASPAQIHASVNYCDPAITAPQANPLPRQRVGGWGK
jgi:hypothetical protein